MRRRLRSAATLSITLVTLAALPTKGAADPPAATKPLEGASFFLEDANNQEEGVVENILTYARSAGSRAFTFAYAQEWPVGGTANQLSVQVPWVRPEREGEASRIGDLSLHYRRQLGGGERRWVVSPRASVVLPTGDAGAGTGMGGYGFALGVPLTLRLGERLVSHTNLCGMVTRNARSAGRARGDLVATSAAQGLVWDIHPRVNLTVETLWARSQSFVPGGSGTAWTSSWVVSPGVQVLVDLPGLPVVPGVAFPVGVGPSRGDHGVVLFLSVSQSSR